MTSPITVTNEAKKLSLPFFDPTKNSWNTFSMKIRADLIVCDMEYLPTKSSTDAHNYLHFKELKVELSKKLQGNVIKLFSSLNAQHCYLGGGRGIKMIKALVDKFHPLNDGTV